MTLKTPEIQPVDGKCVARMWNIDKSFGTHTAVVGAGIDLRAGEIHALLGENGAGKTTLMNVLAGIVAPDAGTIEILGQTVSPRDRRDAARLGIGIVQQHFGLVEELTGAENQMLGHPHLGRRVDRQAADEALRRVGAELGYEVDPKRYVRNLTVGERQRLEILCAMTCDPKVLILDEPTAALGATDIAGLGDVLRRLATQGRAIVYITHKLPEVLTVSDRVTVMRRGKIVASRETAGATVDELAEAIIGAVPPALAARPSAGAGAVAVGLRDVRVASTRDRHGLDGVDLEVRGGEVLGVAGVVGNGQEALAEVLIGLQVPEAGAIEPLPGRTGFIPEDRASRGVALELSIRDNAIVHRHREARLRRFGRLRIGAMRDFAQQLAQDAGIVVTSVDAPASTLSGGNQQKLVLGRELEFEPAVIVAHNPYRGLDVGAIAHLRDGLLDARDRGAAVVVISPDLDELFGVADRLVVLYGGRIVGSLSMAEATGQRLGRMMAGAE